MAKGTLHLRIAFRVVNFFPNSTLYQYMAIPCLLVLLLQIVPLVADTPMFKTKFINLNDLSIGSYRGVESIDWGIWKACYANNPDDVMPVCTPFKTFPQMWRDPYEFVVIEKHNIAHASTLDWWLQTMSVHFIGIFFTIFIYILHGLRLYIRYLSLKDSEDSEDTSLKLPYNFYTMYANGLLISTGLFGVFMVCLVTGDAIVCNSINSEMHFLEAGGETGVVTKYSWGFYFTTMFCGLCVITVLIFSLFVYGESRSDEEYGAQAAKKAKADKDKKKAAEKKAEHDAKVQEGVNEEFKDRYLMAKYAQLLKVVTALGKKDGGEVEKPRAVYDDWDEEGEV